jgi:MYXO-CTERM domain-containing protein
MRWSLLFGLLASLSLGGCTGPEAREQGPETSEIGTSRERAAPSPPAPSISAPFDLDAPNPVPAVGDQKSPRASLGNGAFLVVWTGAYGVQAARVTTNGTLVDPYGITLAPSGAFADVAFDGTNWLVVWLNGTSLFGSRVTPAGVVLDPAGIPLATNVENMPPRVAFGTNEYLVVYAEGGTSMLRRVLGRRVTPAGAVEPLMVGINSWGWYPALAFNGSHFLVSYTLQCSDPPQSGCATGQKARRVSPAGVVDAELALGSLGPNTESTSVASDGSGWVVAWSAGNIAKTRAVTAGGALVGAAPVDVASAASLSTPQIAYGAGAYSLAFREASRVRAARVSETGAVISPPVELLPIAGLAAPSADLDFDGTNFFLPHVQQVFFNSGWQGDVYGSFVSPGNVALSTLLLSQRKNAQSQPDVSFNGTNHLVAWFDSRPRTPNTAAPLDVYGVRVTPAGAPLGSSVRIGENAPFFGRVRLASNGTDWLAVWRSGGSVFATRVLADGSIGSTATVATGTTNADFAVAFGAGSYLVAYSSGNVYAARVSSAGVLLDSSAVPVSSGGNTSAPYVTFDGTNHLVTWVVGTTTVRGARLTPALGVLDAPALDIAGGTTIGSATSATSGAGWLVAWSESGNIRAARVAANGALTDPAGVDVTNDGAYQGAPSVAWLGTSFLIAWSDVTGDENTGRIGGRRVGTNATMLDPAPFVLSDEPLAESSVSVAAGPSASALVAYVRYDSAYYPGEQRVRGRIVSAGRAPGSVCSVGSECASGRCVEDVCCDADCTGACESCLGAHTGGADGTCAPVTAGTDPGDDCSAQAPGTCGRTGACDGSGACQLHAAGVSCGTSTCDANTAKGQICDGEGACITSTTGVDCSPYACASGACRNPCAGPSDCQNGFVCVSGTCRQPGSEGTPCGDGSECVTGHCADGVCCDSACSGTCVACSADKKGQGADGDCAPIRAAEDPDAECAAEDESTCGQNGQCNGEGACARWAEGTRCGPGSCSGVTETAPSSCDGDGMCVPGARSSCVRGYGCDGRACATDCDEDARCADGYVCDRSRGTCVSEPEGTAGAGGESGAPGTGGVAGTSTGGAGGEPTTAGEGGDSARPEPPSPDNESGCGCRVASTPRTRGASFAALGLALLFAARRRRS